MPAWAVPAIAAGGKILESLINKPKNPYADPSKYKSGLTISEADISGIRGQFMNNLIGAKAASVGSIKQVGAGTRAPKGAVLDSLAGVSYNLAKGAASIEPKLQQMKLGSQEEYAKFLMRHEEGGKQAKSINREKWANTFGDLGKIVLLWKAGYFDQEDIGLGGLGQDEGSIDGSSDDWMETMGNRGIGLRVPGL